MKAFFDGTQGYIDLVNMKIQQSLTIAFWIYPMLDAIDKKYVIFDCFAN